MRKKVTTTIYITAEQNERLKTLHDRTKVPVAEYIRQGIDLVLKQHSAILPRQLSLYEKQPALELLTPPTREAEKTQEQVDEVEIESQSAENRRIL